MLDGSQSESASQASPPPPEPVKKEIKIVPTSHEASKIASAAIRSRAKSELRTMKDVGEELVTKPAVVQEAVTYDTLSNIAEQQNGVIYPKINLSSTGQPLRIIDDVNNGVRRAARPDEPDDGVYNISSITSKIDDDKGVAVFVCRTDTGAEVSVPIDALLDAQLVGVMNAEKAANGNGNIFTAEQVTVVDNYLKSKFTGKDDAIENMDTTVFSKAAEDSGQTPNDILRQFLDKHVPEYKPEEGKSLIPAQETANGIRKELLDRLEKGTIASAKDKADVIKAYSPSQIEDTIQALRGRVKGLATDAQFAKQEVREQFEEELNTLVVQIQELEKAKTSFLSPGDQQLEQFFAGLDNGDFPVEVGQRINGALRSGNAGAAVKAVIEEKMEQLQDGDPKKEEWNDKVKKIGKNILFAGGGLSALALFFALMGKKE